MEELFAEYVKTITPPSIMNDYRNDEVYSCIFNNDLDKLKTFTDEQLFKNNRKILHVIALADLEPHKTIEFFKYLVNDRNISLDPVDNVPSVIEGNRALWNEFLYMRHHGCAMMTLFAHVKRKDKIMEPEEALLFACGNQLKEVVDHILETTPEVDITFGDNFVINVASDEIREKILNHASKYPERYKMDNFESDSD